MPSIVYCKGSLEDLSKLQISEGLSATAESIEFNVLGIGHEFWIAIEYGIIVGLTVLGAPNPKGISDHVCRGSTIIEKPRCWNRLNPGHIDILP